MLVVGIIMFAAFIIGTGLIVQLITDREGFKESIGRYFSKDLCADTLWCMTQSNIISFLDGFQMVFDFGLYSCLLASKLSGHRITITLPQVRFPLGFS